MYAENYFIQGGKFGQTNIVYKVTFFFQVQCVETEEDEEDMPPPSMLLWHKGYFELRATEN